MENLPLMDPVKAKKNSPPEGEPWILKCYAVISEPFLNLNEIVLS